MLPKAGKPIKENRRQMVIRNVPMEGQAVQGLAAGVMLPLPHTVMASNLPETVVLTLEQAKAIRHGISVNRNLNRMPGVHPVITVVAEKQPRKDQQDMLKDQEKMDQAILVMILINNPKEERDMVEPAVLADAHETSGRPHGSGKGGNGGDGTVVIRYWAYEELFIV